MKKFISIAVAAIMGFASLPAFGAVMTEVDVGAEIQGTVTAEQAIAAARTAFNIPEELTEFSYDVDEYYGEKQFYMTWSDPTYEKSIEAAVNSHLVPVSYYNRTFDEQRGLSSIRKSELEKTAADFLRATVPQLADRLVLSESDSYGNTRFTFNRYENGIRVENNRATVYVSKSTGEVRSYSLTWDFDSEFTADTGISADEACAVLADKAVRIEYRIFGDKAIPVYIHNGGIYAALDGSTFAPVSYNAYKFMATENAAADMSTAESGVSGGGSTYRLTKEEIAAVEQMNSLISRERVEEIIASMPELSLPENYTMSLRYSAIRYEDHTDYRVVASMDGDAGYGELTLDAESGELLGFYSYSDKDWRYSEEEAIDAEQLTADGEAFIARIKDLDGYRSSGETYNGARYERYVGEIPYPADYKSVTLSAVTGKVTRYSQNTPTAEIVVPDSLADKLTSVKDSYSAELVYAYRAEAEEGEQSGPVLAWKLKPNFDFYYLRAEDGAPIDYRNEKAEPTVNKTDENAHYAWNAFEILRENGITLTGGYSFDDEITKGDFTTLIQLLTNIDAVPYRYYYIDEKEEETLQLPLDREEAARIVAEQMGWEPLIDLNIYSVSFADTADFSGGIGAAAILQGMGVMQGDGSGSFLPKTRLTYGEAYMIAFNLASLNLNIRW